MLDLLLQRRAIALQFGLDGLAIADVALDEQDEGLVAPVGPAERHFGAIDRAVLAAVRALAKQSSTPDPRQQAAACIIAERGIPLGQMQADHLLDGVAEHPGGLRIGFEHAAVGIENDHAVALVLEQGTPARCFIGHSLQHRPTHLVLVGDGLQQVVEIVAQPGHLVVQARGGNPGVRLSGMHGIHGRADRAQTLRHAPPRTQEEQGEPQHGRRHQAGDGEQEQDVLPMIRPVRNGHAELGDRLAKAVEQRREAHVVRNTGQVDTPEPGFSAVVHLAHDRALDLQALAAQARLALAADDEALLIDENPAQALGIARQHADRENDFAHVFDQRRILVEQDAADQDGIDTVHTQRKMGRRVDQHRIAAVADELPETGRKGIEGVRRNTLESGVGDTDGGLPDDVRLGQVGTGRHAAAGSQHPPLLGRHDQKIQTAAPRRGIEQLPQFGTFRLGNDQLGQALGTHHLADTNADVGLDLLQIIAGASQVAAQVGHQQRVGTLPTDHDENTDDDRKGDQQRHQAQGQQAEAQRLPPQAPDAGPRRWSGPLPGQRNISRHFGARRHLAALRIPHDSGTSISVCWNPSIICYICINQQICIY